MPSKDEHLAKASGNEAFAGTITTANQACIDWTLVVLFYAAVHYVEAYLAVKMSAHLRSHTTRDSYVGRLADLKKIFKEYQHLKYFGYNARYEVYGFSAQDTVEAMKDIAAVRSQITPLL